MCREAADRATKQLDWADQETRRLLGECLAPVAAFFDKAKKGLPAFAEDSLGWTSKWYVVADHIPMTSGGRQQAYLQQRWDHHVFSLPELTEMLERVAKRCAQGVDEIEQQMLVRLRLDVDDLPRDSLPELADEQRLAASFRGAIEKAVEHARSDVVHEIGLLAVAEIAERVLAMVVRQLGVSTGLLAGGAVASPYSAGLSLLGVMIINYLLDLVWDWYADPRGKLVDEMATHLDRLQRLIVEGDGSALGLRGELETYARRRARLWAEALSELLTPER